MRLPDPSSGRSIAPASWLIALALTGLACEGSGPSGSTIKPRPGLVRPGVTEVDTPGDDQVKSGQFVYLPVYSQAATGDNRQPLNLAATVFVRNTDVSRPIILTRVRSFDSAGQMLRDELGKSLAIGPMASVDFFVQESDVSGGAALSFLVQWVATEEVSDPVIESMMIGTSGTQGISFIGTGRVIVPRKP